MASVRAPRIREEEISGDWGYRDGNAPSEGRDIKAGSTCVALETNRAVVHSFRKNRAPTVCITLGTQRRLPPHGCFGRKILL